MAETNGKNGFVKQAQFFITVLILLSGIIAYAVTLNDKVESSCKELVRVEDQCDERHEGNVEATKEIKDFMHKLDKDVEGMKKDIEYIKNALKNK